MNNNRKARVVSQENHIYNQVLTKTRDLKQIRLIRAPSFHQDIGKSHQKNIRMGKKADSLGKNHKDIKEINNQHENKLKIEEQPRIQPLEKKFSESKLKNGVGESMKNQSNKYQKSGLLAQYTAELFKTKFQSKQKIKKHKRKMIYFTKGNNHSILQQIFTTKFHFIQTAVRQNAHICWLQSSNQKQNAFKNYKNSNDQRLPQISKPKTEISVIYNYLEGQSQLTNKQRLYKNMKKYHPESIGNYIPISFIVDFKLQQNVVQEKVQDFLAYYLKKEGNKRSKLKHFAIKNYFMQINISSKQINKQLQKSAANLNQLDEQNEQKSQANSNSNLWILKPTSLNRGRGIHLFSNLKQLSQLLSESSFEISVKMYQQSMKPKSFIIQQYIEKPLLIDGYKFDMRVWVFVNVMKINGKKFLKAYLFQHGYSRLASIKYDINSDKDSNQQLDKEFHENNSEEKGHSPKKEKKSNINNKFIHLTNNAVQKEAKEYGQFCEGNQLSIEDTVKYFQGKQQNCPLNFQSIVNNMKKIVFDSISCVKERLLNANNPKTFQLFGYDFLLDNNYKMWLIQINCNPCLEESSQLLGKLLREMLSGLIVLSQLQQASSHSKESQGWLQIL